MSKKANRLSRKIVLIINILIATALVALCLVFYLMHRNITVKANAEECLRIATGLAAQIDAGRYLEAVNEYRKTDYWYELKERCDFTLKDSNVAMLYIVEVSFIREVRYFLEAENEYSPSYDFMTLETRSAFSEELFDCLIFGTAKASGEYDAGEIYGNLISGFAPIFSNDGKIIGAVGVDRRVSDILGPVNSLGALLFIIDIVFIAVFLLISRYFVKRAISAPVSDICDAAALLARGTIDVSFNVKTYDEFETLADSLNEMQRMLTGLYSYVKKTAAKQSAGEIELYAETEKLEGNFLDISEEIYKITSKNAGEVLSLLAELAQISEGNFEPSHGSQAVTSAAYSNALEIVRQSLASVTDTYSSLIDSAGSPEFEAALSNAGELQGEWAKLRDKIAELDKRMKA